MFFGNSTAISKTKGRTMNGENKNDEILKLTEEILSDFDLNTLPLEVIISKCKKLARLKNDFDALKWLTLELSGYDKKALPYSIKQEEAEKMAHWSGRYTVVKGLVPPQGIDVSKLPKEQQDQYQDK